MNEKLRKSNVRKNNLVEKINLAERHKKNVIDKSKVLEAIYSQREISFEEYEKRLKSIFGERSPAKWIEYYDSYIKVSEKEIELIDKNNKKENIKKLSLVIIPVIVLSLIILLYFGFIGKGITGSTINIGKETFSVNVNEKFNENGIYNFDAEEGKLVSLMLNGEIEGEGNVKIYLIGEEEILILDSNSINFEESDENNEVQTGSGGGITGFNIEGAESSDSGDSTSESSSSDDSNSGDASSSESGSDMEISTGAEVDNTENAGVQQTAIEEESQSGDNEETSTTEDSTVNNADNQEEAVNEETISEDEEQNETDGETVNEVGEETGNEQSNENSSENTASNGNEEDANVTNTEDNGIKVKEFSNYCEDSCDLEDYELNEGEYDIKIEIEGEAKLIIEKITYESELNKSLNLSEENETEVNATAALNLTLPPILIKEISNIEILINSSFNLTLDDYFENAKEYDILESENFSFNILENTLEIIPQHNFIGNITTKLIAKNEYGENESNEFSINVVESSAENNETNITTLQYKAVINRPTKWIKVLNTSNDENGSIIFEIPKEAENITIKTGEEVGLAIKERENYNDLLEQSDKEDLISGGITGNVALDINGGNGIITRLFIWIGRLFGKGITGNVISEEELGTLITENSENKIVDVTDIVNQTNTEEVAITYYTDGPVAVEENLTNGKRVKVSGGDELNYTDILAYSEIEELRNVGEEGKLKIYWRENGSFINFTTEDLDGNGKIDYVQWIVPHLSNQTFDIILIVKAEHLDENRTFISDIYESVRELDGNWSEEIIDGHYVRATFERNLTNENDITVYARGINGTGRIEVYEFNDTRLIETFPAIENESYYKIYLTNLSNSSNYSQGIFDLKILNASIEFDLIIDPTLILNVSDATNSNVTVEAGNFSHLSIGDNTLGFINNTNLIVYFPFDTNTTTTTAFDYSGNNLDGVISSGVFYNASGAIGSAYSFNGTSSSILLPQSALWNSSTNITNFTLSGWIYSRVAGSKFIFSKATSSPSVEIGFLKNSGDLLSINLMNTSHTTSQPCLSNAVININQWYYVAMVNNGTGQSMYVNGVLNHSCSLVIPKVKVTNNRPRIGSNFNGGSGNWIGNIDEFMFLNASLTDSQILQIYNNQSSRFFSRGEQVFSNLNGSSNGDEEGINIWINASMNFGSSINVSLGNSSGGTYVYGNEYSFSNNVANNIPLGTPNNYSLKFIFYAGNSSANSFISPTLENYILAESILIGPSITLNAPPNASVFKEGIYNITLNASVLDNAATSAYIYGVNSSNTANFYKHGLLYQAFGLSNGTQLIYNWTSPVIVPDASTVVLYHLDNNSVYGENQTHAWDYVSGNVNLTRVGNAFPNMTSGKFAGAWVFDGNGDYLSDAGDKGALNGAFTSGTFSAWVKRAGNSANGYETIIQEGEQIKGFVLTNNCGWDNMTQIGTAYVPDLEVVLESAETSNSIISDGNWHLITGVVDNIIAYTQYIYVDGVLRSSAHAGSPGDSSIGVRVGGHSSAVGQRSVCDASNNGGSFNGSIDEVAIWNRSLSAAEIMSMYRLNAPKYYWKVNVTDSVGNSNESETREFSVNPQIIPYSILNGPANRSIFYKDIFNITLNATGYDNDDSITIEIYGTNSTNAINFYNYGLLFRQQGVSNNSLITYNWTNILLNPADYVGTLGYINPEALYHLDNNSRFGENNSNVIDSYSTDGQLLNLTPVGNAFPNMTGGKFAGAWTFDGDGDFLNSTATLGTNQFVTYYAWVKRAGNSSTGYETILQDNAVYGGFSLTASCNDSYLQFSVFGSGAGGFTRVRTPNSIISDGQWHLVVGIYQDDLDRISLYVDGVRRDNASTIISNAASNDPHRFVIGGNQEGTGTPYTGSSGGTSCNGGSNSAGSFNGSIDEVMIWYEDIDIESSAFGTNISDLSKMKKGKYYWKANITDTYGNSNESETREFVVRDTSYVLVNSNMNCTDLKTEAVDYYYGYSCSASGYSTCIGLNADLNISSGGNLSVPSSCNIQFNNSFNGQYSFIIEGSGKLNLSGGNITTTNVSNKFNFKPHANLPTISGNNGSISFFNVTSSLNLSDSRINFYNLTISDRMTILNSTDITLGTYAFAGSGRLDRQWRLNVSVYASGAVVSGANVTARNVSLAFIDNKLTASDGAARFNLSEYIDTGSGKIWQGNWTINVTKAGYFINSTTVNLTSDSSLMVNLGTYGTIEVSSRETLHDIYSRINDGTVFNNLSSGSIPCRYVANAAINITSNGHLVLENCVLEMNSTNPDPTRWIEVGGTLTSNYSNITKMGSKSYYFYSITNSNLTLKNSFVSYSGDNDDSIGRRGLELSSVNLVFFNNTFYFSKGIVLISNNLTLYQLKITTSNNYNIQNYANNSLIIDSNISGALNNDLRLFAVNLTLLNTNHSTETAGSGVNNPFLFKKWYVDLRVLNTSGSGVDGANVTFLNVTGIVVHDTLTNSSGDIVRQNVTQYISNGTVRNFWTNYTINVTANGYNSTSISVNITGTSNYTITLDSAPTYSPTITAVYLSSNYTPTESSTVDVYVNFTVSDADGGGTINYTSAKINFTKTSESVIRLNDTCNLITTENATNTRNFTCNVAMWYYDSPGSWNITAFALDNSDRSAQNTTVTFNYDTLQAFVISSNVMSWSLTNMTAINTTASNSPMILNNTGNYNASVKVYSTDLYGESFASQFIPVGNISVDNVNGGCNGNALQNGTNVTVSGGRLPYGNNSFGYNNETSGQEQIYFCLRNLPTGLSSQVFSTGNNPWIIYIFTAIFGIAGSGRKKKKDNLLESNNNLMELDSENILDILDRKLKEKYDLGLNDILEIAKKRTVKREAGKEIKKDVKIPIEVFNQKIGAAESICKYLKENKGMKFNEISRIVGRDQRTVWNNYRNAHKKMNEEIKVSEKTKYIPMKVFSNNKLSMLESVIYYLREERYRNIEIAQMLGKDTRNVWTIWNRARKKNEN